jgi:tetratricopeptide (TPR) repeat protein
MNNRALKYVLSFVALFYCGAMSAQNDIAHVFGQLKDQTTKKKLEGVTVQVFKDGMVFDSFNAGTTGKYDFKLPLGFTYDIKFSKAGEYLAKVIRIDTRNIPEEDRYGGFDMNVDGTLFPYRPGFNTDLLREPMAKASYNPSEDGLSFDFAYSEQKAKEIDAEFKRLDDIEKNLAKLKADFDKFVKDGDQKVLEKKYADAISNYRSALGIFPDDAAVKTKLADAQAKLDEENANKDLEARYKKLIEEGDALFEQKKYTDARTKFTQAKDLKNQAYEKEM